MDVALWSKGTLTYEEAKRMSPLEMDMFAKQLSEYVKVQSQVGPQL